MDAETSDLQHASGGRADQSDFIDFVIGGFDHQFIIDELNRVLMFVFSDAFVVLRVHTIWRDIQAEDWICTIKKFGKRTH